MGVYQTVTMAMSTKQFYLLLSVGDMNVISVVGTDRFEEFTRTYVLNISLLTESELELFKGTLAVMGLLDCCSLRDVQGCVYVKYGNVEGNSWFHITKNSNKFLIGDRFILVSMYYTWHRSPRKYKTTPPVLLLLCLTLPPYITHRLRSIVTTFGPILWSMYYHG